MYAVGVVLLRSRRDAGAADCCCYFLPFLLLLAAGRSLSLPPTSPASGRGRRTDGDD